MITKRFRFGRGETITLVEDYTPVAPEFNTNLGMDETDIDGIFLLPRYNQAIIGKDCISGRAIYDIKDVAKIYENEVIKESLDDSYGPYNDEDERSAFNFAWEAVIEHFFWFEDNRHEYGPMISNDWDFDRPE